MSSSDLLHGLLRTALSSSVAMLLVLSPRVWVRRWLGASAAYLLWLMVPAACLGGLLPATKVTVMGAVPSVQIGPLVAVLSPPAAAAGSAWWLAGLWGVGAIAMAAVLLFQQRQFVRGLGDLTRRDDGLWQAQAIAGLPAVIGLMRPKIVLPADFQQRYDPREQALVLLHERVHLRRGDIVLNAAWAVLRCVQWFNPLLGFALRRFREDQELSCDERVIAGSDGARRSYGNAMLKTGLALSPLPVGCHWQDHHPLKERIAMLKRPVPGKKQRWAMALLSAALACATGYAAWAAQPARVVAAAKQVYEIKVSATLDGVPQTFQLRQPAELPFSFSMTSPNGVSWDGEFTLQPEGERLRLSGTLKADRVVVATPMLVFTAGKTAGIGVSGPANGSPWSLSFLVLEVPVTAPVATTASAPANVVVSSKNQAPPSYPREAFERGISGKVVLEVDVAADGSVSDAVVVESTPRGVFDESTLSAARKWRFNPAQEEGKAVAGKVRVPVWFDMDEDAVHDQASGG